MTMRNLGLSICPDHSNHDDNIQYLELGHKYGFKRILMGMLEVQGSVEEAREKHKKIISMGNRLGYQTFLDVPPRIFKDLKIDYHDLPFLHDIGATGLRLDQASDGATKALMFYNPYNLIIELNMSNNVDYLNNTISYQANTPYIYGCHNFYPQKDTALPYDSFVERSKCFRKFNIHTVVFVTSQVGKVGPWNVVDGLPTLEEDHYLPIRAQAKQLWATGSIDNVIIGNAYASEEELKALSEVNPYQLVLHVNYVPKIDDTEKTVVEKPQHSHRDDMNNIVIRLATPHVTHKDIPNPAHDNEQEFKRGDVLTGNDGFGIYKNELQIVLKPRMESRKNKVGEILEDELFLLNPIKPRTKFELPSE